MTGTFKLRLVDTRTGEVLRTANSSHKTLQAACKAVPKQSWGTGIGDLSEPKLHIQVHAFNLLTDEIVARFVFMERRTMCCLAVGNTLIDSTWGVLERTMTWVKLVTPEASEYLQRLSDEYAARKNDEEGDAEPPDAAEAAV